MRDTHGPAVAGAGSKHSDAADVSPTHSTQLARWKPCVTYGTRCRPTTTRCRRVHTPLPSPAPPAPGEAEQNFNFNVHRACKGKKKINLITSLQTAPGGCWANMARRTSASPCAALCHRGAWVGWGCGGCTRCMGCMGLHGMHGMNMVQGVHGVCGVNMRPRVHGVHGIEHDAWAA